MTHSYSAASVSLRSGADRPGCSPYSSGIPATLSPTGVNPATNHGGRNETAARSPVKFWRRRFRHSTESISGASDHELGSLTRPAHAAVVPGLRSPTAALPFIIDNQPQRIDGTERGARSWGMCRQFPAVADHLQDWPRKRAGMVTSNLLITGGGLQHARPAFHRFNFRAQPRWQAFVYALEAHSKVSVASCGFNKPREAGDEVPENEAFGTHDDC